MTHEVRPIGTLGHCIHCDLAAVINAWGNSGKIAPIQVVETLATIAAEAVVQSANPSKAKEAGAEFARIFANALLLAEKEQRIDRASPHAAGHA